MGVVCLWSDCATCSFVCKRSASVPTFERMKVKGSKSEMHSYREFSLLSMPGKVHGRIFLERIEVIMPGCRIWEVQGALDKARVAQIRSYFSAVHWEMYECVKDYLL